MTLLQPPKVTTEKWARVARKRHLLELTCKGRFVDGELHGHCGLLEGNLMGVEVAKSQNERDGNNKNSQVHWSTGLEISRIKRKY